MMGRRERVIWTTQVRPLSRDEKITGCEHNAERVLEFHFHGPIKNGSHTAQPGDSIYCLCPHGCRPVILLV